MALNRKVETVSRPASADLSASRSCIVMNNDSGLIVVNTSTSTACFGVLMNKPTGTSQAARVAVRGSIVKCIAGAAINERAAVCAVANGYGSSTTTDTAEIVGIALTAAAASGNYFELEVAPGRYAG